MNLCNFPILNETYQEETLPNGIRLIVADKSVFAHSYAVAAVDFGAADLRVKVSSGTVSFPSGTAHYLEHKMFDMPDGDITRRFSSLGGSANAYTGYDMTAFYVECSDHETDNLRLLLEMVSTPWFTDENVEKERGIIQEEIRLYQDSPETRVFENLMKCLYPAGSISLPVAGTEESIRNITPGVLSACYDLFYRPSNIMICCAGSYDAEKTAAMVCRLFPTVPVICGKSQREEAAAVAACHEIREKMEVSRPNFVLGFRCARISDNILLNELIGEVTAELLCGESSALYHQLYTEGLIDAGFTSDYETFKDARVMSFSGDSDSPEKIRDAVLKEAERLSREGFEPGLFHRICCAIFGSRIRELDNFDSACDRHCSYAFVGTRWFDFTDAFQKITERQCCELLKKSVKPDYACLSVIIPEEGDRVCF